MNFKEILQRGREKAESIVAEVKAEVEKAAEESAYARLHNRIEEIADAVVSLAKAVHVMTQAVHRHEHILRALMEQESGPRSTISGFPEIGKKETGSDKPN